ncbi:MAG: Rieske 2Fe-2S domain-containing protein [Rhizobiales bacterium]|nr:Rieske 2Fe-2S domain-containing protein [Hyphomicrobiales bacterium]
MSERRIQEKDVEYNALKRAEPSLPASWYHDPAHHARELATIWRRGWLYVCRSTALAEPLCYRTLTVGDQNIVVLRDGQGVLKAFYNSCRHRGSLLCTQHEGRLKSKLLVCPYHQWSFAADDGRLVRTTSFSEPEGFSKGDYSLFPVALGEWRGSVFINLDANATFDARTVFQRDAENLANFPLEDLVVGHTWRTVMNCNWKTFWENFNECLHCPNVHPELVDLVPMYSRRIMLARDLPDWVEHQDDADPRYKGGMREGAETWSMDGRAQGRVIPSLSAADLARGHHYATIWPSMFIAGYPDHMRIVHMLPKGPEQTELVAEWLFPPETLADPDYDTTNVVDFAKLVMEQDAAVSELNQRGLHAAPFEQGVLMPEEYFVKRFQDWVRAELGE